MNSRFSDRRAAGQFLAQKLEAYAGAPDVLVLGLARGGIPVAFEVAHALKAPLDFFLVRKLGVPDHEEFTMGTISDGAEAVNWDTIEALGVSSEALADVRQREERELHRREALFRAGRPRLEVANRVLLLVDDGLATGATMRAAVISLREQAPRRLVIGVPIAAPSTCQELSKLADEVVCATTPEPFYGAGLWYGDQEQTNDEEVRRLLDLAARERLEEAVAASPE